MEKIEISLGVGPTYSSSLSFEVAQQSVDFVICLFLTASPVLLHFPNDQNRTKVKLVEMK